MSKARWWASMLAAVACAGLAAQAHAAFDRPWMKYSEIAELFEKFDSVDPERRANLVFRVKAAAMNDSLQPADIALTLDSKKGRTALPLDAKGVISFPVDASLRDEDPMIRIATPTLTKVALIIDVLIKLPPQTTSFKYADAMTLVKHAGEGMRKHAGIWALFMPKPDGLEFEFAPGQQATAQTIPAAPERVWNTNAEGKLVIPLNDELAKANPQIVLSALPAQARPHFKVRMQLISSEEAKIK
jgi:hypothetical protein